MQGLVTGEAITRNLRLRADGLSSSLLPGLQYSETDGLKFYPDQPSREDLANQNGVSGIRSQGTAIVASEAGDFVLPGIEIPWWNTLTDSLEYARLPEQTLTVLQGANLTAAAQPGILPDDNSLFANQTAITSAENSPLSYYWMLATALFACAWLYSTTMWYRSRHQLRQFETGSISKDINSQINSSLNAKDHGQKAGAALLKFQAACTEKSLDNIRRELLNWARLHFQDDRILSLENLKNYSDKQALHELLDELENRLYGTISTTEEFNPENLLREITALSKQAYRPAKKTAEQYALPPLYKN